VASWSPAGIVVTVDDPTTGWDILLVDPKGASEATALLAEGFNESSARVSPDGRLIAFVSDETGRDEVYVKPFPGPGAKAQVSVGGGVQPEWRPGTRELVYRGWNEVFPCKDGYVMCGPLGGASWRKLLEWMDIPNMAVVHTMGISEADAMYLAGNDVQIVEDELLKAHPELATKMLQPLFENIWKDETIPEDWRRGNEDVCVNHNPGHFSVLTSRMALLMSFGPNPRDSNLAPIRFHRSSI